MVGEPSGPLGRAVHGHRGLGNGAYTAALRFAESCAIFWRVQEAKEWTRMWTFPSHRSSITCHSISRSPLTSERSEKKTGHRFGRTKPCAMARCVHRASRPGLRSRVPCLATSARPAASRPALRRPSGHDRAVAARALWIAAAATLGSQRGWAAQIPRPVTIHSDAAPPRCPQEGPGRRPFGHLGGPHLHRAR